MKSLKCFFISVFLIISIFLQTSYCVYADTISFSSGGSESQSPTGFNSWNLSDKIAYWTANVGLVFCSIAKIGNVPGLEECFVRIAGASEYTKGYASYIDFVAQNSSYDDNTMTWTFSDDVMAFFNEVLAALKDDITYQYGYYPTQNNISSSTFTNRNAYLCFKNLVQANSSKAFEIKRGNVTIPPSISGDREDREITVPCFVITAYDLPYSGVNGYDYLNGSNYTALYTEDWSRSHPVIEFYILDTGQYGSLVYDTDAGKKEVLYDKVGSWNLTECTKKYSWDMNARLKSSPAAWGDVVINANDIYSFTSGSPSIPVFKTVSEMKNGTEQGVMGQYMPGYTGQPITKNTITQKEINDFSTNYNNYYGSGSGGSGSGSGSGSDDSSGGWLNNLLSGLGKLGDIIMKLLSKVFDIVTDILEFFTDTLLDALDIIPTGFVDFLGALFPFIPKEWITAVSLMLALMLIGTVIKIFKS